MRCRNPVALNLLLEFYEDSWQRCGYAANKLGADAILVYTRRGYMASLISRNRPDCPIFAFTESRNVMRCMDLQWGVVPFQFAFRKDLESNLLQSLALLKAHCMVRSGNLVVAVSDVSSASQSGTGVLQSIQVHVLSWAVLVLSENQAYPFKRLFSLWTAYPGFHIMEKWWHETTRVSKIIYTILGFVHLRVTLERDLLMESRAGGLQYMYLSIGQIWSTSNVCIDYL